MDPLYPPGLGGIGAVENLYSASWICSENLNAVYKICTLHLTPVYKICTQQSSILVHGTKFVHCTKLNSISQK